MTHIIEIRFPLFYSTLFRECGLLDATCQKARPLRVVSLNMLALLDNKISSGVRKLIKSALFLKAIIRFFCTLPLNKRNQLDFGPR